MIFVDTGAWYAVFNRSDPAFKVALDWFESNFEPLITSDYVVDELLTLLRSRNKPLRAIEAGKSLFAGELARIERVTPEDFAAAWAMFQQYSDKSWSFTDCTSFALIERLKIEAAFAFDDHFKQFGKVLVHPT